MNKRICSKLEEALSKGQNLIYLYGEVNLLKDSFFYNIEKGLLNIEETVKDYFLEEKKYDFFIGYSSEGEFKFFNSKYEKVGEKEVFEHKKSSKRPAGPPKKNSSVTSEQEAENRRKAEEDASGIDVFDNTINRIEKLVEKGDKKVGLYLEGFEYIAKLYEEGNVTRIKILEGLYKYNSLTTVISMKDPLERLKTFDITLDPKSTNLISLGYPNKDEIFSSYIYKTLYPEYPEASVDIIDISENLATSKLSLKNALSILDVVVKKSNTITIDSFKEYSIKNISEEVTLEDVIVDEKVKKDIMSILEEFLKEDSKVLKKGTILTGPPGTGKTYLVKALANHFNMFFSAPSLAELKGEFIGTSGANVKRLFDELRNQERALLFLDELDSLFSVRGGRQSDNYTDDIVNQFLVEIDGVNSGNQKIFIIGATNRIEIVDGAIKSRLGAGIDIHLPDSDSRIEIFNRKFNEFNINKLEIMKEGFKKEFIKKTQGFSGRDIDNFVKDLQRKKPKEDFTYDDFDSQLEDKEKEYIDNFKRIMENSIDDIEIPEPVKIIGYDKIKDRLSEECRYITSSLKTKKEHEKLDIDIGRGTILYGPPGNGKTELVSHIANKHEFYLIKILSKSFASISFENSLGKIKEIFENTSKLANITSKNGIILFFDEIDTLIGNALNSQIRGTLLDYLGNKNGIRDKKSKIMFIGATNFYESLDEASIRKGRIDRKVPIENPPLDTYKELLINFWKVDNTVKLEDIERSSILSDIIDKYIICNFDEKKGLKEVMKKRAESEVETNENLIKYINDFKALPNKEKLKKVKEGEINLYSVSDIKDLAREIKTFSYYKNKKVADDKLVIGEDSLKLYLNNL